MAAELLLLTDELKTEQENIEDVVRRFRSFARRKATIDPSIYRTEQVASPIVEAGTSQQANLGANSILSNFWANTTHYVNPYITAGVAPNYFSSSITASFSRRNW